MTTSKIDSYSLGSLRTYWWAFLFVAGNLLFPQLAHLIPGGGPALLPIYFFTLIAAYKFGFSTGLLTAVLSPLLNSLIFGMPVPAVLPVLLVKSVLLAVAAAYIAGRFRKVSVPALLLVVLAYQLPGSLVEWLISGDFFVAVQDFRVGFPGMAIQVLGGYAVLKVMDALKSKPE